MREIKFRAWDTEYKRWEKPDGISLKDGVAFSVTGDGYIDDIITNYPEYVIQQYTGLTDRHDVEIYEGDVISQDGYNTVVEWSEFSAWWALINIPDIHSGNHLSALDFDKCEVVGNIYENPELLKEED